MDVLLELHSREVCHGLHMVMSVSGGQSLKAKDLNLFSSVCDRATWVLAFNKVRLNLVNYRFEGACYS